MEQKVLSATARTEKGKGVARRLRREGRIPGVVYGHDAPQALSVDEKDFHKAFSEISESTIITLKVDTAERDVLIKDYDEDIRTGRIMHIDFYEIERGKKLRTHVGIELTGSPKGVREGGILEHSLYELEIECLPKDIPEHIVVEIGDLETGHSLHVSDIAIPEGVRVLNSPEQTVVAVAMPRAIEEEAVEEEGEEVEPEVIGEETEE